ncbi:hypothetical protein ACN38_g7791 [Penicillium nordicum]|uniref:Helitron helicase-like domain-containing protein n=1 Tax=Penicillium nordicum TaxID=229535 RepID=A0A0M8NXI4_9EURO|nr:hypothetical protein ACN38_g7791 [Penicillium nordicum]
MVRMLGPAHLFVPFSAADLHWDDLMRHLPRYEDWKTAYTTERMRIASINLRDNPHIAAQWFYIRFDVFRDMVLRPHFAIVNYWDRLPKLAAKRSANFLQIQCNSSQIQFRFTPDSFQI